MHALSPAPQNVENPSIIQNLIQLPNQWAPETSPYGQNIQIEHNKIIFQNLTLTQPLRIDNIHSEYEIVFRNCNFQDHISAVYSQFDSLQFRGGCISSFDGLGLNIENDLVMTSEPGNRFTAYGTVRLTNAVIRKRLILSGGRFREGKNGITGKFSHKEIPARGAIDAGKIHIGSSVWMEETHGYIFRALGLVSFRSSRICGRFIGKGAHFVAGRDYVHLDEIPDTSLEDSYDNDYTKKFAPSALLQKYVFGLKSRDNFKDLPPAKKFKEIEPRFLQSTISLDLYNAEIERSVHLSNAVSEGTIRMGNASIGSKLSMKGAKLYEVTPKYLLYKKNKKNSSYCDFSKIAKSMAQMCADYGVSATLSWGALDAFQLKIKGSIYLCSHKRSKGKYHEDKSAFCAIGSVTFSGANVGGRFTISGAHFFRNIESHGDELKRTDLNDYTRRVYAIDLSGIRIALNLVFAEDTIVVGPIRLARSILSGRLSITSTCILASESDLWSVNAKNIEIKRDLKISNRSMFLRNVNFDGSLIGASVNTSLAAFSCASNLKSSDINFIENFLTIEHHNKSKYDKPAIIFKYKKKPVNDQYFIQLKRLCELSFMRGILRFAKDFYKSDKQANFIKKKKEYRALSFRGSQIGGEFSLIDSRDTIDETSLIIGCLDMYESNVATTIDISGTPIRKFANAFKSEIKDHESPFTNYMQAVQNFNPLEPLLHREHRADIPEKITTNTYSIVDLTSSKCRTFDFNKNLPGVLSEGITIDNIAKIDQRKFSEIKIFLKRCGEWSWKVYGTIGVQHISSEFQKCFKQHGATKTSHRLSQWADTGNTHNIQIEGYPSTGHIKLKSHSAFFLFALGMIAIICAGIIPKIQFGFFNWVESAMFVNGALFILALLYRIWHDREKFLIDIFEFRTLVSPSKRKPNKLVANRSSNPLKKTFSKCCPHFHARFIRGDNSEMRSSQKFCSRKNTYTKIHGKLCKVYRNNFHYISEYNIKYALFTVILLAIMAGIFISYNNLSIRPISNSSILVIATLSPLLLLYTGSTKLKYRFKQRFDMLIGYGHNPFIFMLFSISFVIFCTSFFSCMAREGGYVLSNGDIAFGDWEIKEYWNNHPLECAIINFLTLLYTAIPAIGEQPSPFTIEHINSSSLASSGNYNNIAGSNPAIQDGYLASFIYTILFLIKLSGWIALTFLISGFRRMLKPVE